MGRGTALVASLIEGAPRRKNTRRRLQRQAASVKALSFRSAEEVRPPSQTFRHGHGTSMRLVQGISPDQVAAVFVAPHVCFCAMLFYTRLFGDAWVTRHHCHAADPACPPRSHPKAGAMKPHELVSETQMLVGTLAVFDVCPEHLKELQKLACKIPGGFTLTAVCGPARVAPRSPCGLQLSTSGHEIHAGACAQAC
jgi:hypothetical protein